MARTKLDELVGTEAEDVIRKIHPDTGKQDEAAEENSRAGGDARLPSNIKPFTLNGK